MKRNLLISSMLAFLLFFSFNVPQINASNDIPVYVHGQKQWYDQSPVMDRGRVLVPLRGIFEALGASVNWNEHNQSIDVYKANTKVWLQIGSTNTKVNGKTVKITVPAQMRNGRTLVPIRFVSEALGEQVHWDEKTQTVYIGKIVEAPPTGKELIRGMKKGMTKQQVKQTERAYLAREESDTLYYTNATQYGFTGTLVYTFQNNKLESITMLYPDSYLLADEAETLFWILYYHIEQQFGSPVIVDDNFFDDPYDYVLEALWLGQPDIFLQVKILESTFETRAGILFTIQ